MGAKRQGQRGVRAEAEDGHNDLALQGALLALGIPGAGIADALTEYYNITYEILLRLFGYLQTIWWQYWDEDTCNELVQRTLLRVVEKASGFHVLEGKRAISWVIAVARNVWREYEKETRPWHRSLGYKKPLGSSRHRWSPQSHVRYDVAMRAVRDAVTKLRSEDPKHGDLLYDREYEGLTYEQLAEKHEVALGTVSSRLHAARGLVASQLETFLGRGDPFDGEEESCEDAGWEGQEGDPTLDAGEDQSFKSEEV